MRNNKVDLLRGIAILMVVLGHTMTGCVTDSTSSLLYNLIWALQMPLFMLISGYVTRYSKKAVSTLRELGSFMGARTVSYLLPWAVWTFLVRGIFFQDAKFLNLNWLLFNMDSGYWFLFSLWTIALIFGVSKYLAGKIAKKDSLLGGVAATGLFYLCGMAVLTVLGVLMGMNFLCIKLTLYYMPFYFAGYLFGHFQEKLYSFRHSRLISDIIVAGCLLLFIGVITRVNLFTIGDGLHGILLRILASLTGCIALCSLVRFSKDNKISHFFHWVGRHSLGIYLSHYLFLSLVKRAVFPSLATPSGMALVFTNFILCTALTCLLIWLLYHNPVLKFILFGEKQRLSNND